MSAAILEPVIKAEDNLKLVHSIAHRFRGRGIEYDELYSAGCVGLMKAIKGFDATRGLCFSTYAVPVIMGEVKRLFRDGGTVKVGRSLKTLWLKVSHARELLIIKTGEEPHLSDIAKVVGVTPEEVAEAMNACQTPISLATGGMGSDPYDDDGQEFDIPTASNPNDTEQNKITDLLAIKQSLATLNSADRKLLILRYWKNLTQTQVGEILQMTQVQVSRRERKLLNLLRELLV